MLLERAHEHTVHRVLVRHRMPRLAWLHRTTGQPIRQVAVRYERAQPGQLVHVDVKKLGPLRDGGGSRVHGRDSLQTTPGACQSGVVDRLWILDGGGERIVLTGQVTPQTTDNQFEQLTDRRVCPVRAPIKASARSPT